jgi:predicted enzyme related to lactoylglutathione lyase
MTSAIQHITIDCHDPELLARFWSEVLGWQEDPDDPNRPGDPEYLIVDPKRLHPGLLFIPVPESKTVKNRVHLDLRPADARDVEVERIEQLGGTVVADRREPDGTGWVTMTDPEGNELCVVRSAAERGEPTPVDKGERAFPDVRTTGELEVLTRMLDWYREGVIAKVEGVSATNAAVRPLGSATSIAGLVKHLAVVEDSWLDGRFAGNPEPEPWKSAPWDDDRDWEFTTAPTEPLADSVALYEAAIERSRAAVAGHGPDDLARNAGDRPFNLRFVLVHLIEETARHLGHLDVLRELLDGTTGE